MITQKQKELTQWALEYALKNGVDEAKIALFEGVNSSYSLRDGKLESLEQASEIALGIQLYVKGRFGSFSTNSLNPNELKKFIREGKEATLYLAKDLARKLPDASRYYQGGRPSLDLYDSSFEGVSPDTKIAIAQNIAQEVLGKDDRILSVASSYSDGESASYLLTSNGFEGDMARSWYTVSSGVSMKGKGDSRPSDFWYDSSLHFIDLAPKGVGKMAYERVARKLNPMKIKSGRYQMVVDALTAPRLLAPLLSATYGSAIQQQNSFLLNRLHEQVASDLFTLYDHPHMSRASGARYFDGEGVATVDREIFSKGVLNTFFINTYIGHKLSIAPTISGPSLLEMSLGDSDLDQLVVSTHEGVLVTGLNGGNTNSTTGDFSFGVEGFLIERGELTHPISEMNITGNLIELWSSLIAVGNDPVLSSSRRIPSLVFEGVNFSGL